VYSKRGSDVRPDFSWNKKPVPMRVSLTIIARTIASQMRHPCKRCDGCRWVCEAHPDRPWEGPNACGCGAPGAPCPACNKPDDNSSPALPVGFEVENQE
jgi:hypothetical protein